MEEKFHPAQSQGEMGSSGGSSELCSTSPFRERVRDSCGCGAESRDQRREDESVYMCEREGGELWARGQERNGKGSISLSITGGWLQYSHTATGAVFHRRDYTSGRV